MSDSSSVSIKDMFDMRGINIEEVKREPHVLNVVPGPENKPAMTLDEVKAEAIKSVNMRYYAIIADAAFVKTDEGYVMKVTNEHLDFMDRYIKLLEMNGDTVGMLYLADGYAVADVPIDTIKSVYHQMLKSFNYLWHTRFTLIHKIKDATDMDTVLNLDISFTPSSFV